jgi:hypothetical protein
MCFSLCVLNYLYVTKVAYKYSPMNNIVDLLRKDYFIVLPNGKTVSSEYLHLLKNYYKNQIYTALDGKTVGKSGVIWTNSLDVVFPCAIAMWELGVSLLIDNFMDQAVTHPNFKNFYQAVDFVVAVGNAADHVFTQVPHIPAVYSQMDYWAYINDQPEPPIYQFLPNEYPEVEYELDQPLDGNTIATTVYVRGEAGQPSYFKLSHADACATILKNVDFFDFKNTDRVLHTKTLYHGNLLLHYTLPGLVATPEHHWATMIEHPRDGKFGDRVSFLSSLVKTCQDSGITKCLIPPIWIDDLVAADKVHIPNTAMMTIYGPDCSTMQSLFDKFELQAFYNNFGCLEGGTLAISKTTRENLEQYEPNRFEHINPAVDIELHPTFFKTKLKTKDTWNTVPDQIEIKDQALIFKGVNNVITIDNQTIDLDDANAQLVDYLGTKKFALVPDFKSSLLYLAFFDRHRTKTCQDIESNTGIKISKTARFAGKWTFGDLTPIRWFSPALLLYAFQNQKEIDFRP